MIDRLLIVYMYLPICNTQVQSLHINLLLTLCLSIGVKRTIGKCTKFPNIYIYHETKPKYTSVQTNHQNRSWAMIHLPM